jgi:hypothetical protein
MELVQSDPEEFTSMYRQVLTVAPTVTSDPVVRELVEEPISVEMRN